MTVLKASSKFDQRQLVMYVWRVNWEMKANQKINDFLSYHTVRGDFVKSVYLSKLW